MKAILKYPRAAKFMIDIIIEIIVIISICKNLNP